MQSLLCAVGDLWGAIAHGVLVVAMDAMVVAMELQVHGASQEWLWLGSKASACAERASWLLEGDASSLIAVL